VQRYEQNIVKYEIRSPRSPSNLCDRTRLTPTRRQQSIPLHASVELAGHTDPSVRSRYRDACTEYGGCTHLDQGSVTATTTFRHGA
jgi:hypothetical protein